MRTRAMMVLSAAVSAVLAAAAPAAEPEKALRLDLGGGVKLEAVLVPAGEFQMGSPSSEKERQKCETPVHKVRITRPFHMGKFEVTNAQYRRFRPGHHSRHLDGPDQPVLFVSWHDADAFCRWLSARAKRNVRLPTEAEWEYACRAGTTTRFHTGNAAGGVMNSADLAEAGWTGGSSKGRSRPVGQKAPNAFGLHDMHGNAWEWCADWFADDYYARSPAADPAGPKSGRAKVLRGGSYFYWVWHYCRSAHRYRFRPDARECVTGFRVAVETTPYKPRPAAKVTQPFPAPRRIAGPHPVGEGRAAAVAARFGKPVVLVPKVDAPPAIDGRLDDAAWKRARPLRFRYLCGRAAWPPQDTVARVVSDAATLYLAVDCADDDMARLTVAGEKRDDPVWQGDTAEVFLDPRHAETPGEYFHIAINPAGVTLDSRGKDASWNPKLAVKTTRGQSGWRVELAVPFAELGLKAGEVPTVWGLNVTRYRPELHGGKPRLGTLVPHSWPVDEPDKLRPAMDAAWAQTLSDLSHVPRRFGHAVLAAGTTPTPPPETLFEVVAREDFADGTKGKFSKGEVVDGGYMGVGKALLFKPGQGATLFRAPLTKFRDVQLLAVLRARGGSGVYWHTFGKIYGSNKCCARQVTTITRDFTRLAPTFNYCDGGGTLDVNSSGVADPYYAGFRKHVSWCTEPTIGRIHFAGPDHWAVAYTRVGQMKTQHPHNRAVDPDRDSIPGWFFHASGDYDLLISEAVMFRGSDWEPPARPGGLTCTLAGGRAKLAWKPAEDNTLTVWYRVCADGETVAEVPALSAELAAGKVAGKKLTVQAVDFFENFSEPSEPVTAR